MTACCRPRCGGADRRRADGADRAIVQVILLDCYDAHSMSSRVINNISRYFVISVWSGFSIAGGVYALPIALLGNKPPHSAREVNVSHRIAPVAKSTQGGPDR
jgi:hypothetical protein